MMSAMEFYWPLMFRPISSDKARWRISTSLANEDLAGKYTGFTTRCGTLYRRVNDESRGGGMAQRVEELPRASAKPFLKG